jgi:hypothetical protein
MDFATSRSLFVDCDASTLGLCTASIHGIKPKNRAALQLAKHVCGMLEDSLQALS